MKLPFNLPQCRELLTPVRSWGPDVKGELVSPREPLFTWLARAIGLGPKPLKKEALAGNSQG